MALSRAMVCLFLMWMWMLITGQNCSPGLRLSDTVASTQLASSEPRPTVPLPPPSTSMPADFSAGSMQVCASGCTYSLPSQAVASAADGSVVEIQSGDYADCLQITASRVIIRGVGATRPHLHTQICLGKGILVNEGQGNRIENLELSDFATDDQTGAGIRQDASATDLAVVNVSFHDGQFGILTSSTGDRIMVKDSFFDQVGVQRTDGEISVPIFITGSSHFQLKGTQIINPRGGASLVKSRAADTRIDCSVLANLEGPDSYSLDVQVASRVRITNSVIEQSSQTQNLNMVAVGSISADISATGQILMIGNTFVNDASGGSFTWFPQGTPSDFRIDQNLFIGPGTLANGAGTLGSGNQTLATRPASLGAYPALPSAGTCTDPDLL